MADHLFVVTPTETRPRQVRFHVSSSGLEFEWDVSAVIDWLDIANARVEVRDQLRSDRLVADAPATLDPASQTAKWTFSTALYPVRATHYKMVLVVEKTDGTFVSYPGDDPGFTKVVAYGEGEDPLNLESTLQQIQNATGLLGSIYNSLRNPPRVYVVDKTYEGFEIEGQTFATPAAARDAAVAQIEADFLEFGVYAPILVITHFNGLTYWSEDPNDWYPDYVAGAYDPYVFYYSAPQRARRDHFRWYVELQKPYPATTPTIFRTIVNDGFPAPILTELTAGNIWATIITFPPNTFIGDQAIVTAQQSVGSGAHEVFIADPAVQADNELSIIHMKKDATYSRNWSRCIVQLEVHNKDIGAP